MAVINITLILNCILQIISICIGNFSMRKVTKILIIPLMLASFFIDMAYIGGYELKPVLYAGLPVFMGLIFGWLGDIFLLKDTGFVKGLACFLLGHIFYIIHFARNSGINENPVYLFVLIPYAVYFIIILKKLMPVVDHKMKPPVLCYMSVIITMGALSSCLKNQMMDISFHCITVSLPLHIFAVLGSTLFIISDTILAFNTFRKNQNRFRSALVMITYIPAQFLIMMTACYGI